VNGQQWDGAPGFYEVWYLTLTDPATGTGLWIRYTMVAPLPETGDEATCSLWFLAMPTDGAPVGRKASWPVDRLRVDGNPFTLRLDEARLTGDAAAGAFEDVAWDLRWTPNGRGIGMVHPTVARLAKTKFTVPQVDLAIDGEVSFAGRTLPLAGARAGQAHLWGTKHASRWAWLHCNELGEDGAFVEAVSVYVPRFGRELGPSTPVQARVDGAELDATGPVSLALAESRFALTGWTFAAHRGRRKLVVEVDAPRETLAGVTYHDPDGEKAYCYNTEVATARFNLYDRHIGFPQWTLRRSWRADGRAHFEYAQREPLPDVPLLTS
jgi:hypothetical protein